MKILGIANLFIQRFGDHSIHYQEKIKYLKKITEIIRNLILLKLERLDQLLYFIWIFHFFLIMNLRYVE